MFCDELGCPIQPNWLTKRFSTLRATAGIATGSLHILRHTAATLALTASPRVPLHIVAGRLGDDPTILLGVYAHLLPRSDAQAAEALAAVLADKRHRLSHENGLLEPSKVRGAYLMLL